MTPLAAWSWIVADGGSSFPQQRIVRRAVGKTMSSLVLPGPALSVAHHLDPGPPAAQLEQRVLSPLALSLGTPDAVRGRVEPRPGFLSRPPGGRRRYPPAQDGPRHSPGALTPRSPLASLSSQPHARLTLFARFPGAAPASARSRQLSRSARPL
jgi:hypothetical protein